MKTNVVQNIQIDEHITRGKSGIKFVKVGGDDTKQGTIRLKSGGKILKMVKKKEKVSINVDQKLLQSAMQDPKQVTNVMKEKTVSAVKASGDEALLKEVSESMCSYEDGSIS